MTARYHVVASLGSGGFGTTYRARRADGGDPVVIKVPSPDTSRVLDEAVLRMRINEMVALLNHPAVANWREVIETSGRLAVVGEYIDGVDLATLVRSKEGGLPARPALQIMQLIAAALAHAAELKIVHGDIKPSNVMVSAVGVVKVVDFGLTLFEKRSFDEEVSAFFDRKDYMAPERLAGENQPSSDVFSAGRVLYELLSGRRPVRSSPNEARAGTSRELHLARLTAVLGSGHERVIKLFSDTQEFHPGHRPRADELAERCANLLDGAEGRTLGSWARETLPEIVSSREEFPLIEPPDSLAGLVLDVNDRTDPDMTVIRKALPDSDLAGPPPGPASPSGGAHDQLLITVGVTSFSLSILGMLIILWVLYT